jgi:hypothetical protein
MRRPAPQLLKLCLLLVALPEFVDLAAIGLDRGVRLAFTHNAFERGKSKYGYFVEIRPRVECYGPAGANLRRRPRWGRRERRRRRTRARVRP